ncbi:MAG: GFA family protein [Halofilum sp. (in: g-proteobacteria)]
MTYLHGSCLCGGVRIRIPDEFAFVGYCHCSQCRKWSGSPFAAGGVVDSTDFAITRGEELVSCYASSEDTQRGFCSRCGSSLFSIKHALGKHVVRLGALDDEPTQRPDRHIFVAHKAPWFEITDGLEQYEQGP